MSTKKQGGQSVRFQQPPVLLAGANAVGKKEGDGPLAADFDLILRDDRFAQPSWEKAESRMQQEALRLALQKAGLTAGQLDYLLAGDLLNQCISSSFAARGSDLPFLGLYGACSTMGEGLILAAMLLDGGFGQYAAAMAPVSVKLTPCATHIGMRHGFLHTDFIAVEGCTYSIFLTTAHYFSEKE